MGVLDNLRNGILREWIIDSYHRLWYDSVETWQKNQFLGFDIKQSPSDLWIYQDLITAKVPAFILQTGVCGGGSVCFFAHLLDLVKAPPSTLIIGVDIELTPEARRIDHPRVRLIEGSSVAPETLGKIKEVLPAPTGFVSLDSDHSKAHVLAELHAYAPFVAVGSHMVAEDTNINGHPVTPSFGPGPFEAVEDFMRDNSDFIRDDAAWKRHLFSCHQYGWLQRVR